MFVRIFVTECIYKSRGNNLVKSFPFFICKSVLANIFFWSRNIDFFMSNIQIATKNNRFLFFQFFYMHQKCWVPLFFTKRKS